MTRAHRFPAIIERNGTLRASHLPFEPGERVEVIMLAPDPQLPLANPRYPLRGTKYQFDDPFQPAVAPDEWESDL